MKPLEIYEVLTRFEFRCSLTDSSEYHIDHWFPQAKGGSTSISNCYPLEAKLNMRKGALNPFEFFEREDVRQQVDPERFEALVFWLAINNDMSVQEFREFTYWAYENENPNVEDWKNFARGIYS